MKTTIKVFMSSVMLLCCMTNLQAQYTVFKVTGAVEMSVDGKTWNPLKKKDELKGSYQIRIPENSSVDIIDSKNLIYSHTNSKTISVNEIVNQRKTVFEAINKNSGNRKAIGGAMRGDDDEPIPEILFTDVETLDIYDNWSVIPPETIFYITIYNTGDSKAMNVCQGPENEDCGCSFSEDFLIEGNTSMELKDVLFGKQENSVFVVVER
jgi:hypothetical protein